MIPVLIHHELDQKNQTGGVKGQQYVKYCVGQAEKYNEKVVLFGDLSNKGWCEEWEDVSNFKYERWERFLKSFENYSDYPDAWAKGIFKRFFVFEEYMKRKNLKECVILDSDVLTYINFSEWEELKEVDVALEISEIQKISAVPYDNQLRWSACIGVGYMTLAALIEFIDFCINMYEKNKKVLMEKWKVHQEYSLPGGVCEMSLLYLWIKETRLLVKNIGLRRGDELPVIVVGGKGLGYTGAEEYEVEKRIMDGSCVKFSFVDGIPIVNERSTGKVFKVYNLHFGGKSKLFMKGIVNKEQYTCGALIEWYYWVIRGKASAQKRKLIGKK